MREGSHDSTKRGMPHCHFPQPNYISMFTQAIADRKALSHNDGVTVLPPCQDMSLSSLPNR